MRTSKCGCSSRRARMTTEQRSGGASAAQRATWWGGGRLCRHYRIDLTCAASRKGIPFAIASSQVDHLEPRPGQVGALVWELPDEPTPVQQLLIRDAAGRGAQWALDWLAARGELADAAAER